MKERISLEDLVRKVSDGMATDDEKALFSQWMLHLDLSPAEMQHASTDEIRAAMLEGIRAAMLEGIRAAMLEEILAGAALPKEDLPKENSRPRGRWYRLPVIRYASSAAAVLLVAAGIFYLRQHKQQPMSEADHMTTVSNTGRQIRHIRLPDSSEVWLNSGSSLSFNEGIYTNRERRVSLQGEGYFQVAKNPKPFIVSAGGIDTRVLATAFNIENYSNESEMRVTLVQGKVMVEDEHRTDRKIVLAPNDVMHYSRRKADWTVKHADASQVIQWINGLLAFHELPLTEALGRMEKRYGIVFKYDSSLLAGKYVTGNFGIRPWPQVLDDVLYVHRLTYHQKNGVIYITK
jgi:transmembrane sensor